jgi:hypothetical protein
LGISIVNAFIDLRNEMVIEHEFTDSGRRKFILKRLAWQSGLAIALVAALIVSGKYTFPFFAEIFGIALLNGFSLASLLQGVSAIIAMAAVIFILWRFSQIVFAIL